MYKLFRYVALIMSVILMTLAIANKVDAYTGDFQGTWTINDPYIGNNPPSGEFYLYGDSTGSTYLVYSTTDNTGDLTTNLNALPNTGSSIFECLSSCPGAAPELYAYFTYTRPMWNNSDVYVTGQFIQHGNNVYTALIDSPTAEPGTDPVQWQEDGTNKATLKYTTHPDYNLYTISGGESLRFTFNPTDFPPTTDPDPDPGPTTYLTQAQLEQSLAKFTALIITFSLGAALAYQFRFKG